MISSRFTLPTKLRDMASIDLSKWLGKPTVRVEKHDNATPDGARQNGASTTPSMRSKSSSGEALSTDEDNESIPATRGGDTYSSSSRSTPPDSQIQILVPPVSDSSEYEHLPGHFKIDRVLNKIQDARGVKYRVKLLSGEKQVVSEFYCDTRTPLLDFHILTFPLHSLFH